MHAARPALVSEEEFLALPESTGPIELLDGEVYIPPAPTFEHQDCVLSLGTTLRAWARAHPPARVGLAPLDVRLGPNRIVQPDVALWVDGLASTASPIATVPTLIVEVLSPGSRGYDRLTKRLLYAEAGVAEYWILDPGVGFEVWAGHVRLGDNVRRFDSRVAPGLTIALETLE